MRAARASTGRGMLYYVFFLPIGVDVRRGRLPIATLALVGLNLAIFGAVLAGPSSARWLAQLTFVPADIRWWTPFTACFLHAGLLHLAGNMLYLALFGAPLEERLGRPVFVAFYVASGALSMLAQAAMIEWLSPEYRYLPIVGASGAVAGLLGAVIVRLPHARVRVVSIVLCLLHGINRTDLRWLPAPLAIAVWLALQLVWGLVAMRSGPAVAYWAHLGGWVAGIGLALLMRLDRDGRDEAAWSRGRRYLAAGQWFAAIGELERASGAHHDDVDADRLIGRAYVAAGARRRGLERFEGVIERLTRAGALDAAVEAYAEMVRLLPGAVVGARTQLALAEHLLAVGEFERARLAFVDVAEAYAGTTSGETGRLRALEVEESQGRASSLRAWRAIDGRQLPPRLRARLAERLERRSA